MRATGIKRFLSKMCYPQGMSGDNQSGFTLIELSIVLVILGLLTGGVLVGQDLIVAAQIRAQLSQIEKFNTAKNTFYGKYLALPGDLNASTAAQFGFAPRGPYVGEGDGNGIIEGWLAWTDCGICLGNGETAMFWVDLTTANGLNLNLIEGGFNTAQPHNVPGVITGTNIARYMPTAKIGGGDYVYVYSGGSQPGSGGGPWTSNGINYFGVSVVTDINGGSSNLGNTPGMSPRMAYTIDRKIDDGFPQSGRVTAEFPSPGFSDSATLWAYANASYYGGQGAPPGGTASPSNATCYDNGGVGGATMVYSTAFNGGNSGNNCALTFQMQ